MTQTQLSIMAAAVLAVAPVQSASRSQPEVARPQAQTGQTAQPPKFQSSVDVTPIDVSVVDERGRPIRDLTPADFNVRIDNNARRVVSAEWVSLVPEKADKAAPAAPLPEGYSSNENGTGGRLIMIVVDEPNIRFGGALGLSRAAAGFIDHLTPSDRVAAVGLGTGSQATPFLADRARVKQAISRMVGQKPTSGLRQYNIALTEALAIANGDQGTTEQVILRECANERTPDARLACAQGVQFEASETAMNAKYGADQTFRGLRDILTALRAIEGSKTLILMSEGFIMDSTSAEVIELGGLAAGARTSLYALQLDNQLFDITDARMPMASGADRSARSLGLETLAGASRGTLFKITGSESVVFDRIEAELAGYYLLGIESDSRDSDGRSHPVRVDVPRRGALVRARRQILNASAADLRPKSPREAVASGLSAPLLMSALPLRVVTFTLQGPERSKLQLLIHADIGTDYAASKRMALGYVISDAQGRTVDSQTADVRLAPVMNGVPSALEYVAGASVAPGDYTLRLAVADGDKVGSIEHPIHAALQDAGPLARMKTSELMVGGPLNGGPLLQPTIGYTVTYGIVHGYLEAYGADAGSLKVKYEIATDDRSPAIMTADVPGRVAGEGRMLFSHVTVIRALPPGKYVMRAVMTKGDQPVKTLARAFEVAAPAVLMTSASGLGSNAPSTDGELFLPVEEKAFATPFRADDALKTATLEPFRARLAPAVKDAFDKGVGFIAAKDYVHAESNFKAAIQPDNDSTPAMAYLAVCFAASGHDVEAASAFQTALVDGSDIPQIYVWLSEALLRTRELAAARSVLEEAAGRWPADTRFTRPLAMLFGTFGKGREAVRTLERYIASGTDSLPDRDALAMGVEWIYQVHAAGAVVHSRAEDLKLAHSYADQYAKANGPKQELLKQWLDFLDREKR